MNHQPVISRPVRSGPSAPPALATPAQMAIALGRSRGEKTLVVMDSVAGMMKPAPSPMSARDTSSTAALVAMPPSNAAPVKITRPNSRAPLRP